MTTAAAKSAKKPSVSVLSLETLAVRHVVSLDRGKKYYKKADAALDALLKQAKAGDIVSLPDAAPVPKELRGKKFRVSDKFEKRNSIGVGLSARRYELEEIEQP
jgi:hypothetical protein